MSFDPEWEPVYFTKEVKRVETDKQNIGIFREGADPRDFQDVDTDLEKLNSVLQEFSEKQNLKFSPSYMYYHYRFDHNSTVLRMCHTILTDKRDPTDNDAYFVGDVITNVPGVNNIKYIARLNNRMSPCAKDISVWVCEGEDFKKMKDLEGRVLNTDIHRSMNSLYRWPGKEVCDPFWEIAKTVRPFLRGRGFC